MDKLYGLLFVLVIGSPLIIITLAISWVMNDEMDKGKHDDDSDVRLYHVVRDRKHRSMDRNHKGDKK